MTFDGTITGRTSSTQPNLAPASIPRDRTREALRRAYSKLADDVTAEEVFQVASKVVSKALENGKPMFRETFVAETSDWFGEDVAEQIAKRIYS